MDEIPPFLPRTNYFHQRTKFVCLPWSATNKMPSGATLWIEPIDSILLSSPTTDKNNIVGCNIGRLICMSMFHCLPNVSAIIHSVVMVVVGIANMLTTKKIWTMMAVIATMHCSIALYKDDYFASEGIWLAPSALIICIIDLISSHLVIDSILSLYYYRLLILFDLLICLWIWFFQIHADIVLTSLIITTAATSCPNWFGCIINRHHYHHHHCCHDFGWQRWHILVVDVQLSFDQKDWSMTEGVTAVLNVLDLVLATQILPFVLDCFLLLLTFVS